MGISYIANQGKSFSMESPWPHDCSYNRSFQERQRELHGPSLSPLGVTALSPTEATPETEQSLSSSLSPSKPSKSKSPSPRREEKQTPKPHKRAQPVNVREVSPEEISTSGLHQPLMEKISVTSQALVNAERALLTQPSSIEEWEVQLKV